MEIVPIEIFGVHVDIPFAAPLGFHRAKIEDFGTQVCDGAKGLGIRPEQLKLKRWDELFGYELAGTFFGENGTMTRTAERIKLGVRNARTAGDWNLLRDTLVKFYNLMNFPDTGLTVLSTHAHAKFPSQEERDSWVGRFAYSPLISRPAALGYVRIADWEKDIRVLIEPSNMVADAVFVMWDTQFTNDQDWDSFLTSLPNMMENAVNLFDLGFEPLREKV